MFPWEHRKKIFQTSGWGDASGAWHSVGTQDPAAERVIITGAGALSHLRLDSDSSIRQGKPKAKTNTEYTSYFINFLPLQFLSQFLLIML